MKQCFLLLVFGVQLFGQSNSGGLRLKVLDSAGLGLRAAVELVSEANQFRQAYATSELGRLAARNLPFGLYRLEVERPGFAAYSGVVEVRSAVPVEVTIELSAAPAQTAVEVRDAATLV